MAPKVMRRPARAPALRAVLRRPAVHLDDEGDRGNILQQSLSVQRQGHRSPQGRIGDVHRSQAPRHESRVPADMGGRFNPFGPSSCVPRRVQSRSCGAGFATLQEVPGNRVIGGPGWNAVARCPGQRESSRRGRVGRPEEPNGSASRSCRRRWRCDSFERREGRWQEEGQEKDKEEEAPEEQEEVTVTRQQKEEEEPFEQVETKRRRQGEEVGRRDRGTEPCQEQFFIKHELFNRVHPGRSEEDVRPQRTGPYEKGAQPPAPEGTEVCTEASFKEGGQQEQLERRWCWPQRPNNFRGASTRQSSGVELPWCALSPGHRRHAGVDPHRSRTTDQPARGMSAHFTAVLPPDAESQGLRTYEQGIAHLVHGGRLDPSWAIAGCDGHPHPTGEVARSASKRLSVDISSTPGTPRQRDGHAFVKARVEDCHHRAEGRGASPPGRIVVEQRQREGQRQVGERRQGKRQREEGKGEAKEGLAALELLKPSSGRACPVETAEDETAIDENGAGWECPERTDIEMANSCPTSLSTDAMTVCGASFKEQTHAGDGPKGPYAGTTRTGLIALYGDTAAIFPKGNRLA